MTNWNTFDDALPVPLERVLERWRELVVAEEPWSAMPLDDVNGMMPRIITEMLDLARDPDQVERRHRLVSASRAHGGFRRIQRCAADCLRSEFTRLSIALRVALQCEGFSARMASDAVDGLESDLVLARLAAARGFDDATFLEAAG